MKTFQQIFRAHSILASVYFYKGAILAVFLVFMVLFPVPEYLKYPAFVGFIVLLLSLVYFTFYNFFTLDLPLKPKPLWNGSFAFELSQMVLYYLTCIPFTLQLRSTMRKPAQYPKVRVVARH